MDDQETKTRRGTGSEDESSVAMTKTGVIHGRFQVLHTDHMKYLLAGKARCNHLVVGITNPDPELTGEDLADTQRSMRSSNPLTYFERYTMVRAALLEAQLNYDEFSVVPLPINMPALFKYYVPMEAVFYLTIYDQWGKRKLEIFRSLGLRTEILWERPPQKKGISGKDVRRKMMNNDPWEHLVPPSVATLMKRWDIPSRLRTIGDKKPPTTGHR